jgi:3-oxoadipate enol-lactonase
VSSLPAYVEAGNNGSTLLFLHGVGGGHAAWDAQLPYFAARGYRAVAWDAPGYGASSAADPYDLERVAAAADTLIGHLGTATVVLIGHSMGGFIALETYARYPDRVKALALCFTSPAFGGSGGDFQRKFVEARLAPLDAGKSMAQMARALTPTLRSARSLPGALEHAERIMSRVPEQTYRKAVRLLTTFDRRTLLPQIGVPTLVLAGSDDRIAPPSVMERMASKIPDAEYHLLEGCGHLGPIDQPEAFNDTLEQFLVRHSL